MTMNFWTVRDLVWFSWHCASSLGTISLHLRAAFHAWLLRLPSAKFDLFDQCLEAPQEAPASHSGQRRSLVPCACGFFRLKCEPANFW
jgi:hypothetical protein